jgi:beta-N-acetylhexosaminidase
MKIPKHALMIDIAGTTIAPDEVGLIQHPLVGGVILFTRNFNDIDQVSKLVDTIRSIKNESFLIAVDHEGGRVQRFKNGFTQIPPMKYLGSVYDREPMHAVKLAYAYGVIIAHELGNLNIDLNFSPVVDLDLNLSEIIGNRAFHSDSTIVVKLATSFIKGLRKVGMSSVGKHFPSHAWAKIDSHMDTTIDDRSISELSNDFLPYQELSNEKMDAIMLSHVIFPSICVYPTSLSKVWIQNIIKNKLGLSQYLFSDDLSMQGLKEFGTMKDRVNQSIEAGANMVLICNQGEELFNLIRELEVDKNKDMAPLNESIMLNQFSHQESHDEYLRMISLISTGS